MVFGSARQHDPRGAGSGQPFPLSAVSLLDSAFRANQSRNTAYLRFVDINQRPITRPRPRSGR